ncbi:BTAD domain-containing putative transcriptional regulator [Mycolicibacterium sp. 050232]|nr:BTAD domain-containing putative transcriptional regulator [Mycolicibacterium sp. 050232]MED5811129.1 BTAD domain-containing putative transcriptional regulator [Mycolicibacterium sp. 050232]
MDGAPVVIPGAKPRAILTMLGLHGGSVVPADVLMELLWGDDPPRTAAKALQTHISGLRHALGDGFVLTEGTGWRLNTAETDAARFQSLARSGRDALAARDTSAALIRFDEAVGLWRGVPELPEGRRGVSEKTRWVEAHAALVEDRADALLATGRAAEIIGDLEAAVADAPLRERRWGQLMLALYRAGRQGEALGAYRRARSLLADELGVDPGPELRRLEAAIVAQDAELDIPATQQVPSVTRAVTFLLTDIEGSTAAWEADSAAMAVALARHDEIVELVVTSRGGRLIKTRGEGDATFSVFDRPSAAASAAIELQDAIFHEPWALADPMRIRVALHTGEAELRDGDYFGRAVNRAARLRSQASGGQILCSGATAELVIDSLSDDVALVDLGMRQLKNLARPEHLFELRLQTDENPPPAGDTPIDRPIMPAVLGGPGPFVGRDRELAELLTAWQSALTGGTAAVLIAGEPGVGKTRLAGEWGRQAYAQGAVVLYGRSDEDLGAPYQPFAEALRTLVPCVGTARLRGMRGVEALLPLVPGLSDVLPDLAAPPRGDPDTERYALFDAVVALLGLASVDVPIVLVLDDLHWAAKPTLLLLRHLLRFGEHARVQIIGTYRSTDLDRSHPLAAMLADLHRDGSANRIALGGLDQEDVSAYVAEAGYADEELARALASVTAGNPFFLIEALRHVDESGGHWDPSTLPQGVREAVSRRLSRLPVETNKALAAAAVVGSQFSLDLVEQVVGQDLVDAFDEACQAGIIIEELGGLYRFNHALVRQSLLAELASVRRMRLHQRIAATLETLPGADDELLAELAHHYFECAWAGNALKAVEYCRRAGDQAMARLAYEGAADLYDHALHALDELDDELPDRDDQRVQLLVTRCEALLAAGDVSSAASAVSQLKEGTRDSARLAAWATCFDGQLSMLVDPERLDDIELAVSAAAVTLAELGDAAGEAKAHTVRAGCLARLGRVADCEPALDNALTAARQAREHRLVNAVLAGAPLAALWGPSPVPRAGGRCLDVVRLLRITTDSPAVEATSTRCQAVLEAFRGRAAAARRMIDSARRTVTELGLRHALLEVEHFAGIVELVLDDPAAAELHLRLAYNGFRRMGLDADTAETAALLARACLLLDRGVEADELCSESERLAGHALKAAIAWRTVRAQLLSAGGSHKDARQVAEGAVAIAERTDALVDHGDACLALATVLGAAGDVGGARTAAEHAVELYELKGAVALSEKARLLVGEQNLPIPPAAPEVPVAEFDNACVRAVRRLSSAVHRQAWAEYEEMLASNVTVESHRRIVGGFPRTVFSSTEWTQQVAHLPGIGAVRHDIAFVATRGDRLALSRLVIATADQSPGAPEEEWLQLQGLDEEGRIELAMWFDLDDIDTAMAELDSLQARFEAQHSAGQSTRRLQSHFDSPPEAGIASDTACVRAIRQLDDNVARESWDELDQVFAPRISLESHRKIVGFSRTEISPSEWASRAQSFPEIGIVRIHRALVAVRGERLALVRSTLGTPDENPGAPRDELLHLIGLDTEGRISLQVSFDIEEIEAALTELDAQYARFEQERSRASLENAATRINDRMNRLFAYRSWEEVEPLFTEKVWIDDRRRGIRGEQYGRASAVANVRTVADLGVVNISTTPLAVRGDDLCLSRVTLTGRDGFNAESLTVTGVAGGLIETVIAFDLDDLDAAFAELDARYLAGEAAPYAQTWSTVMGAYAAFNRREIPPTTPDWVNIDKRHAAAAFAPGDMVRYIQAAWEDSPDTKIQIAAVHRLSPFGAVVTHFARGTSQDGFDAEWRDVHVLAVDGERVSRSELFDEAALDAALARFDELSQPVRRLENAASRATDRFLGRFAARDWDAMAKAVTDDIRFDDRRRVINADLQIGRESFVENFRIAADLGATQSPTAIATRGERVVLARARFSLGGGAPEEFGLDLLHVIEVDSDNQIRATVTFDPDDFDAAIAELDARYLAGESVDHARSWTVIARNVAAFNRREPLITTQDWVTTDHRRATAFEPGDITPYIHSTWDVAPDINLYIESVHRLSGSGALFTQVLKGTSQEGFNAEWRDVIILTVDGEQLSSLEVFDEADLDAALARFNELSRPAQPSNAASQAYERLQKCFIEPDLDAMATMVADNMLSEDRRHIVSTGIRRGRDAALEDARAVAGLDVRNTAATVIATRGERLVLRRSRYANRDEQVDGFHVEILEIIALDDHGLIAAVVTFDSDDFDAALKELDARYLAGEAATHAQTWSTTISTYAALNRHQLPAATPNWTDVDHRRTVAIAAGGLGASLRAIWDITTQATIYVEAVHRLSDVGVVVTHMATATSQEGFDAEWRDVCILTVEGDRIKLGEVFDEADLDAALARFDELNRQAPRLENAASRVAGRFGAYFAARDWDAITEILAEDVFDDDRRRVVNAGTLRGREDVIADASKIADVGANNVMAEVIAIRGARLVLSRVRYSGGDGQQETFHVDALDLVEVDADEHLAVHVAFDPDDTDSAFAELDARYLAGEAADCAHAWSLTMAACAALNRHELPSTTADFVDIDHRRAVSIEAGGMRALLRTALDHTPVITHHIEAVHRLTELGSVITQVARGTSDQGFEAEWRIVAVLTVDGDLINRCEVFDEGELNSALTRFDELSRPAPRLCNSASRMFERIHNNYAAGDWGAVSEALSRDAAIDDRRRLVGDGSRHGRDAVIAHGHAVIDVGLKTDNVTTIAIRGSHLALTRVRVSKSGGEPDRFSIDDLQMVEIDANERILAIVVFDLDDIDSAFAELDARYLAGEASAHAHTWSVITRTIAAANRHELPSTTPDWVNIDHHRATSFEPGGLNAYIRSSLDDMPEGRIYVESVHRLSGRGAVITHAAEGATPEGFEADWRGIDIMMVEGDLISRSELFDESDLDAALARFDELTHQPPT